MVSVLTVSCAAKLKKPLCDLLLPIVSWRIFVIVLKPPSGFSTLIYTKQRYDEAAHTRCRSSLVDFPPETAAGSLC